MNGLLGGALVNHLTAARRSLACAVACAAILLLPSVAPGVIIDTVTGIGNTSAPSDDPGWANVGTVGIGSAVYLGNRWAVTASHVWAGSTTFSGTTYQIVPGSETLLTNNGALGRTQFTDLVLYQLATDPGLPAVTIAASTPAVGSAVTMIGAGRNRGAFTTWSVNTSTSPFTWTVSGSNVNAAGYLWDSSRTMRWGTNRLDAAANWIASDSKSAYVVETQFTYSPAYSTEAHASAGDSGGAVFFKNGSRWELAGIMLAVDAYSGQPGNTAVFGNQTYSADLSFYRSQIVQVVPEPSSLGLVALGAIVLAARGRRCWRQ